MKTDQPIVVMQGGDEKQFDVVLHCNFCDTDSTVKMPVDLKQRDVWLCKACNPPSSRNCKIKYAGARRRPSNAQYADQHLVRGGIYTIASVKRWQHGTNIRLKETGNASFDLMLFTPAGYEETEPQRLKRYLKLLLRLKSFPFTEQACRNVDVPMAEIWNWVAKDWIKVEGVGSNPEVSITPTGEKELES